LHWKVAGQMLQWIWNQFFSSTPLSLSQSSALGLSLRGWMLKPLSLELVCGPMGPLVLSITFPPKYFPSLFTLATLAFFGGGFSLISKWSLTKRLEMFGNFWNLWCMWATEPFYTGAHRHSQKLDFESISNVGNPCFHIDRYGTSH
jgi:hypothetical protein